MCDPIFYFQLWWGLASDALLEMPKLFQGACP